MAARETAFMEALDGRRDEFLERCTRCGKCVEACPMTDPAGIDTRDPKAIVGGILDLLRDGPGTPEAERWATACSLSGACIPACGDGVNPRLLLSMARAALNRRKGGDAMRRDGVKRFKEMSRGVKVLSRLQLPPDLLARLGQVPGAADEPEDPDLVFYTGCNLLKTPHIGLLCLDILDALGATYRVLGGPSHCCGVLQLRAGDLANSGRLAESTLGRFTDTRTGLVLSWCPSCMLQMDEFALPHGGTAKGGAGFDLTMFITYLEGRLDDLRPLMTRPVNKRVGLHEHSGVEQVTDAAIRILQAVPGLEYVDLEQPRLGYSCTGLKPNPEIMKQTHAAQLRAAAAAGVDTLAGVYHVCHRELCSHDRDWPFEVRNFLELVGESMGIARPDLYKRYHNMHDADLIMAEAKDLLDVHGLDPEDARDVIVREFLGG